ncbi:MAG: hypothetical protein PHU64_04830 [Candidatus Omnitrophica bacterium]|nr:hypothetical protein [Candidatus Omnitrophota bacterium]MDD5429735.1 hypothetical protein [Candidatus Omnitrophota bacterium]
MKISAAKIKIFKIKNRRGYAGLCLNHLTEGKTLYQVYDRMVKALRRSKITIKKTPADIRKLVASV